MPLDDTHPEVRRLIADRLRSMTPRERLALHADACRSALAAQLAGLRLRHPGASEPELRRRAGVLRLGEELARRVYGPDLEAYCRRGRL